MKDRIFEKFFLSGETATSVIQTPGRGHSRRQTTGPGYRRTPAPSRTTGYSRDRRPCSGNLTHYLISTFAPTSSNFFLMLAASSFETPSLSVPGAPSTRSLASFSPRLVTSRTTLIVLILSPAAARTTVNSVFSSSAGAAAAPAGPAAAAGAGIPALPAADPPNLSSPRL